MLKEFCALGCNHLIHVECAVELLKFGSERACPLCRAPIQLADHQNIPAETLQCIDKIERLMARGEAFWSTLSVTAQQEMDEAIYKIQAAAEKRYVIAQYLLGRLFDVGMGKVQSDVEAVRWYKKAAKEGFTIARRVLGEIFEDGRGVAKSDVEAAFWYQKSRQISSLVILLVFQLVPRW